jgi:pimeloyl-ACP methyl ester carboxylesterase
VTLIYDKRTVGYSLTDRNYSVLADDALAGVELLRARADIDPARVGMWGLSEGTWVAEIGAARSPEVAFLVFVGASGLSPAQQTSWAVANQLHHVGVSGPEVHTISVTALRLLAGVGLFPEASHDPVPVIENIHQPVLATWGALDHNSPPDESSRIIRQALEKGGYAHYTIRFSQAHSTICTAHRTASSSWVR